MNGVLEAVQQSLITTLSSHQALMDEINGLYDGPPARADFPFIAFSTGAMNDWSHKTGTGRELSLAFTVYDDGETAARLHRIMALAEEALEDGLANPPGWQIVTFNFRRTRILRGATNPWSGLVEYRARCLKQ